MQKALRVGRSDAQRWFFAAYPRSFKVLDSATGRTPQGLRDQP
jgi:hypothetical protein